ncbi:LemA family protein [Candidatus Mycoplasma pogonae]
MPNIYDNQNPHHDAKGFEPLSDNRPVLAQAGALAKTTAVIASILSLGIMPLMIRNNLLKMQTTINQAAATIDVFLAQRFETLTKLMQSVKSYKEFEKDILTQVTELRSLIGQNRVAENSREIEALNNSVLGRLIAISENYPDLKSSKLYADLMEQVSYQAREIAASRRLYNNYVNEFNTSLLVWPTSAIASFMKLQSKPLYQASQQERQDVSFENL